MATILDSREQIKKVDPENMLGSIEMLPAQLKDGWQAASQIELPSSYRQIDNIVIAGMGGSALGAHVIKHLYKTELSVPIEIVSHYELPAYVRQDSLVLISSNSGTTEEALAAANDAQNRGAKLVIMTMGGELAKFASKNSLPTYLMQTPNNPSGQPRMAIGYTIAGQMAIMAKLGLINLTEAQIDTTCQGLANLTKKLNPDNTEDNLAKNLAFLAYDKILVLVGSEHLAGSVHVTNNQLNENAKTLTAEWPLPEFNHHYMEALTFPKLAKDSTLFLLFNSSLYHEQVIKRFPLTKQIIEGSGYQCELIQATAPTKLEQVFEIILLGEYLAFYLPILYGINPSAIPNVQSFKQLL